MTTIVPRRAVSAPPDGSADGPDARGRFGRFGGQYVPETLMAPVRALERAARSAFSDPTFLRELAHELETWVGRPTPLTHATRLGECWGADVWLKREDLNHTGAHKINNAVGQARLAAAMGASRVIAETGAGQHGVAAAAACARVALPCVVYMGSLDVERQAANVDRMRALGATVVPVDTGDRTLRAAINQALRDWVAHPEDTYYLIGSAVGPHPYPWIVRELQSVIGREARRQVLSQAGRLPDAVVACMGGGSNAIGLFHAFLDDPAVRLLGIEAGGRGDGLAEHSATIRHGQPGVLHGSFSLLLQDEAGQIVDTHSIAPGLDYPGVGPEHSFLAESGRATYEIARDQEALGAFHELARLEGIIPALESSHALAGARRYAARHPQSLLLIGLSGRGDKDLETVATSVRAGDVAF